MALFVRMYGEDVYIDLHLHVACEGGPPALGIVAPDTGTCGVRAKRICAGGCSQSAALMKQNVLVGSMYTMYVSADRVES